MRTNEEQDDKRAHRLIEIERALRALEVRAKKLGEPVIAYLIDLAALEARQARMDR